jgi:sterol 3beta-glucosyltransferase
MSVDSYFFAAFQNNDKAFKSIQNRLSERPAHELPRIASALTIGDDRPTPVGADTAAAPDHAGSDSTGPLSLKKLGSVLRPFKSKSGEHDSDAPSTEPKSTGFSVSVPFLHKSGKAAHDSVETLQDDRSVDSGSEPMDEQSDGYPPRQSGAAPSGMDNHGKGAAWSGWIKKPARLFGSASSTTSLHSKGTPTSSRRHRSSMDGLTDSPTKTIHTRSGRGKSENVTEVIERVDDDEGDSESDEEGGRGYEVMEGSVTGDQEDKETEKKFKKVFALSESEELIDREFKGGYLASY